MFLLLLREKWNSKICQTRVKWFKVRRQEEEAHIHGGSSLESDSYLEPSGLEVDTVADFRTGHRGDRLVPRDSREAAKSLQEIS
ncbi:hypothetical protein AVEN_173187-1 [Araneus ventricosus]|uniref:Uncharacterized protein n=1 Tax=Araneus ventricosus TaxID=182803 RepID=A0A4Y2RLZ3_ARAVE|nr:hypothetical protein AVEN_173187-1 [Araneus ventricosus]